MSRKSRQLLLGVRRSARNAYLGWLDMVNEGDRPEDTRLVRNGNVGHCVQAGLSALGGAS